MINITRVILSCGLIGYSVNGSKPFMSLNEFNQTVAHAMGLNLTQYLYTRLGLEERFQSELALLRARRIDSERLVRTNG